jgi:hypothetical protein
MKNDMFLKTSLTVIALSLLMIVGQHWQTQTTVVQAAAPARQQWEYRVLVRFNTLNNLRHRWGPPKPLQVRAGQSFDGLNNGLDLVGGSARCTANISPLLLGAWGQPASPQSADTFEACNELAEAH